MKFLVLICKKLFYAVLWRYFYLIFCTWTGQIPTLVHPVQPPPTMGKIFRLILLLFLICKWNHWTSQICYLQLVIISLFACVMLEHRASNIPTLLRSVGLFDGRVEWNIFPFNWLHYPRGPSKLQENLKHNFSMSIIFIFDGLLWLCLIG